MTVDIMDYAGRGLRITVTESHSIRVHMHQPNNLAADPKMILVSPSQAKVMAQALLSAAQMAEAK